MNSESVAKFVTVLQPRTQPIPSHNPLHTPAQLTATALNHFCGQCHRTDAASGEELSDLGDARNARDQPLRLAASTCFLEKQRAPELPVLPFPASGNWIRMLRIVRRAVSDLSRDQGASATDPGRTSLRIVPHAPGAQRRESVVRKSPDCYLCAGESAAAYFRRGAALNWTVERREISGVISGARIAWPKSTAVDRKSQTVQALRFHPVALRLNRMSQRACRCGRSRLIAPE